MFLILNIQHINCTFTIYNPECFIYIMPMECPDGQAYTVGFLRTCFVSSTISASAVSSSESVRPRQQDKAVVFGN